MLLSFNEINQKTLFHNPTSNHIKDLNKAAIVVSDPYKFNRPSSVDLIFIANSISYGQSSSLSETTKQKDTDAWSDS